MTVYRSAVAVTPHDTNTIRPTVALYVGGAGNVAVVFTNDEAATFTGVTVGTVLPIEVKQVKATNTTATAILALR